MKSQTVKTLGYTINVQVPENVQEFDRLAKKDGACLEQGILNIIYRSVLAQFRSLFCEQVEAQTQVARETKDTGRTRKVKTEHPDGSVTEETESVLVYSETEADYLDRVIHTLAQRDGVAPDEVHARFAELANSLAGKIPFDPSEKERAEGSAGPKKPSKTMLALAAKIVAANAAAKVAGDLTQKLGFVVLPDVESLARAITEDQRRKRLALEAEYGVQG